MSPGFWFLEKKALCRAGSEWQCYDGSGCSHTDERGHNHCFCAEELILLQSALLRSVNCRILVNTSKMSRQRTNSTGYAWLVKGSKFPLEDLPGSATETHCSTFKSGGQEEMVLKLVRKAPRCVIQNENASWFLDRSKSIQTSFISL